VSRPFRPDSRVLIASEDSTLRFALSELLAEHAPGVVDAGAASVLADLDGRPKLRLLVLVDSGVDSTALDRLQPIKQRYRNLAILLVSAHPTIEHATESIRRGAEDYVPVPYVEEVVRKEVARILEAAELRDRVTILDRLVAGRFGFEGIVSLSASMRPVFDRATASARSDTPVLLIGETGTGKELVAHAIHASSRRANRPFVPINCAALPHDLVESELFGHRRGAFSGAVTDHPGLFVAAHGGTLFLDEVGELPLDVQAKLLRVLQDGDVRPVGGLESRRVDVRIIAASNRGLAAMRDAKLMRQDLFYRLSVFVIEIPPLRQRREDLPPLTEHFLRVLRARGDHRAVHMDPEAFELLSEYAFPGNVRELENMVESLSLALAPDRDAIRADDVRAWFRLRGLVADTATGDARDVPLKLADLEAWAIAEALQRSHGNKSAAAHVLGISRDTLYRKLHELGLDADVSDSRA